MDISCGGCRTSFVVVVEGLRHRERAVLEKREVARVGHPVAVLRLVVHHETEGLLRVASVLEPLDALVGDDVRDIAFAAHRVSRLPDEVGVVVVSLPGQYFPMVEARREAFEMPFPDDGRFVSGLAEEFGEGLLRAVEHAGGVVVESVLVRMLPGEHAGAAGAAERVRHEAVREAHALFGDPVEIRGRGVAAVVAAHHLRRVVVGHDVEDVHRPAGRFGLSAAARQGGCRETAQNEAVVVFHIGSFGEKMQEPERLPAPASVGCVMRFGSCRKAVTRPFRSCPRPTSVRWPVHRPADPRCLRRSSRCTRRRCRGPWRP